MIDELKPYPAYVNSCVPWLGTVPEHWRVRRLRNVAHMRVSNVDKHTKDGEMPVRLCNYVDVYNNNAITEGLNFMSATATREEIAKFCLKRGDVLITKDSEAWNDIGVPAIVRYEADDLLCGYHLALLRPAPYIDGLFLFRALQSKPVSYQFHIEASGVTRFGLSQTAIKSIWLPIPPLEEQAAITHFLDHVDQRIQRYIYVKRKLIGLLYEERQIIIQRAVTRGIDPNATLRPSGVDWLGDVPQHWEVKRAKYLFREVDRRTVTGTEELLSLRMHRGLVPHKQVSTAPISAAALIGYKKVLPGQLVMNRMRAAIGMFGVAYQPGLVSPDYAVLEVDRSLDVTYFANLFKTRAAGAVFRAQSKGLGTGSSGFMRLYTDRFGAIKLPVPPREEQSAIVRRIDAETEKIDRALKGIEKAISLFREYRASLIANVATGKTDVRDAAARLADEQEEDRRQVTADDCERAEEDEVAMVSVDDG